MCDRAGQTPTAVRHTSRERPRRNGILTTLAVTLCGLSVCVGIPTRGIVYAYTSTVQVALTRQAENNGKLRAALGGALLRGGVSPDSVDIVDIPCIEHVRSSGYARLRTILEGLAATGGTSVDSIVLTSPEAARVFFDAWALASGTEGMPVPLPVSCLGRGTSAIALAGGTLPAFEPSVADAGHLATELPMTFGPRVLYPASSLASDALVRNLNMRGFEVERVNTYTTQRVRFTDHTSLSLLEGTDVVTFGSPSAVRAWSTNSLRRPIAACIGDTSRRAAEKLGFSNIFSPAEPSIDGWMKAVVRAVESLRT